MGFDFKEMATIYAVDGKNSTAVLRKIAEYSEKSPDVLVSLTAECDISASMYLQEEYGMDSVYNINYSIQKEDGKAYDGWVCRQKEKECIYFDEAQIYFGYDDTIEKLMLGCNLKLENFNLYSFGNYVIYVDKNIDEV